MGLGGVRKMSFGAMIGFGNGLGRSVRVWLSVMRWDFHDALGSKFQD